MYKNVIATGLAIALIGVIDASLISSLPFGLWRIHLLPLIIIFIFLLTNIRVAAWWALGGGLILELFSFNIFGFYIVLLWLVLALIYLLFEKIMTNRSLYSVMTVAASVTILCDMARLILDYQMGVVDLTLSLFLGKLFLSLAINVILATILFYIFHLVARRLRPVFLNLNRL